MTDDQAVNPLWRRLNDQTQEGYDLQTQRPGGVYVSESPDYHAHDVWGIVHLHQNGTVPHVHEMEIQAGQMIRILDTIDVPRS